MTQNQQINNPFSSLIRTNNDKYIQFNIENIDVSIINTLRRIILSEIENVGFDFSPISTENTIFYKNTSPLHNEFLAHRFAMIPLNFTPDEILDFNKDNYKFILKKKNTTSEIIDVTTEDILIFDNDGNEYNRKFRDQIFPKNYITNDYVLINKLKPNIFDPEKGDELDVELYAIKNIAKKHSSFSGVSICTYINVIDIAKAEKNLNAKINKMNLNDSAKILEYKNNFKNLDQQKYFHTNQYNEPNLFCFKLHSECYIKPEYIFLKAFEVLDTRLENLKTKLNNNEFTDSYSTENNIYDIAVKDETHTIGNLIQTLFYNKFIREDLKEKLIYIGYNIPHPLDNTLIFRFIFATNMKNQIKEFIIEGIEYIQLELKELAKKWFEISQLNKSYAKDIENII